MAKAVAEKRDEETAYLVLIGAERYVSSYVERGKVVEKGQVISCGPMMRGRLLSDMRRDVRTNDPAAYFREATESEIDAYIHRLENVDPMTGDPTLVAEVARNEARDGGRVERGEIMEIERRAREEEGLQPAKSRRRRATKSED